MGDPGGAGDFVRVRPLPGTEAVASQSIDRGSVDVPDGTRIPHQRFHWAGVEWNTLDTQPVSKWADMIVLNHNLFEIPPTEIHKTEVERTIFKGSVVYKKR